MHACLRDIAAKKGISCQLRKGRVAARKGKVAARKGRSRHKQRQKLPGSDVSMTNASPLARSLHLEKGQTAQALMCTSRTHIYQTMETQCAGLLSGEDAYVKPQDAQYILGDNGLSLAL